MGHPHSAVISVGPNANGHPSDVVIRDLKELNYRVHSTWYPELPERARKAEIALGSVSTSASLANPNGSDLTFRVDQSGVECREEPPSN